MEQMLLVACPLSQGPGKAPACPSLSPSNLEAASIHTAASPGLGTAEAAAKSTCLSLIFSPCLTLAAGCYLFYSCQESCCLPPSFYLATASHLGLLISLSASPDKCAWSRYLEVIVDRLSCDTAHMCFSAPT